MKGSSWVRWNPGQLKRRIGEVALEWGAEAVGGDSWPGFFGELVAPAKRTTEDGRVGSLEWFILVIVESMPRAVWETASRRRG